MPVKRKLLILLLNLVLILVTSTILAQSVNDYGSAWYVIGSAGDHFVTGGDYQLSFTLAQDTPPQISQNGDYILISGFWSTDQAQQPMAVTNLIASNEGGQLRLDWTAVSQDVMGNTISGVTYKVYRAQDQPYFAPGVPYATGLTNPWHFDPDVAVVGDPDHSYAYLVRADYTGLLSANSNRVGCFSFALAPGSH